MDLLQGHGAKTIQARWWIRRHDPRLPCCGNGAGAAGDDVFADDPTVNACRNLVEPCWALRRRCSAQRWHASNLCAILAHCSAATGTSWARCSTNLPQGRRRGGVRQRCKSPQPGPGTDDAAWRMNLADIEAAIKPDDALCPHPAAGAGEHLERLCAAVDYV